MFRSDRKLSVPYARCSLDRLRDRWSRRIDHDLPDGFRTEGSRRLVAVFKFYVQSSDTQSSRDFILHKGGFDRFAVFALCYVFRQRMTDSLNDTALRLDSCESGIDGDTAIHNRRIIQNGYFTRKFYRAVNDEILANCSAFLRSDEIFSLRLQMKLNPPPSPAARQISSRSDFIHRRWIYPVRKDGFS